jgi:two-component system CheB/CheR fusion protein
VHRSGKPTDPGEWPFTARSGRRGWCYSTVFEIPGGSGTPTFICMDVDITQRKEAEQALERSDQLQRLLLSELDHRVRNNLASLTTLIDISARDSRSVTDLAASIRSRVQAMSVVHALLSREHWHSVDLRQLIITLAPGGAQQALHITGPAVAVVPRQATALGMVLQELLVNSQKYGALARAESDGGYVDVGWSTDDSPDVAGESILRMHWRERGGAPITEPVKEGVGTGLVRGLVRTELRGEATLRFPRDGAAHEFLLTLDARESTPADAATQALSTPA